MEDGGPRSTDGSLLPGRHHVTDHGSANAAISPSTRPLDSSLDCTPLHGLHTFDDDKLIRRGAARHSAAETVECVVSSAEPSAVRFPETTHHVMYFYVRVTANWFLTIGRMRATCQHLRSAADSVSPHLRSSAPARA